MSQKNKNFRPFVCIESVGVFPFDEASILLINQDPETQQTDYNGKTIVDLVHDKQVRSWQAARNRFPGDVRKMDPGEILSFWNEKKLNNHFKQDGAAFVETLIPFISIEEDGVFRISVKFHEILTDLEKTFSGRMLLVCRDESLHMVMEEADKKVFLKTGNVSSSSIPSYPENEPLWVIPLETQFYKMLRNKSALKLEFRVVENNLFVKNTGTGKEQSLDLKPSKSSFNFASRWNPPEEGPLIETVVTKDVMEKLRDISLNSRYKRLGFIGEAGKIQAALFGDKPEDFLYLGTDIGICQTEFMAVTHPMPLLADDYIVSIYSNHVLRLRSLTQEYEWMTFFEKEYSQLPTHSTPKITIPTTNQPEQTVKAALPVAKTVTVHKQPLSPVPKNIIPPKPEQSVSSQVKTGEVQKSQKTSLPPKSTGYRKPNH